jgi:hypothetical protein
MEQVTLKAEKKGQAQSGTRLEKSVELSVVIPISERHDDLRELYLQ